MINIGGPNDLRRQAAEVGVGPLHDGKTQSAQDTPRPRAAGERSLQLPVRLTRPLACHTRCHGCEVQPGFGQVLLKIKPINIRSGDRASCHMASRVSGRGKPADDVFNDPRHSGQGRASEPQTTQARDVIKDVQTLV